MQSQLQLPILPTHRFVRNRPPAAGTLSDGPGHEQGPSSTLFFSEVLSRQATYLAVRAVTDTEVWAVPADQVRQLAASRPEVSLALQLGAAQVRAGVHLRAWRALCARCMSAANAPAYQFHSCCSIVCLLCCKRQFDATWMRWCTPKG